MFTLRLEAAARGMCLPWWVIFWPVCLVAHCSSAHPVFSSNLPGVASWLMAV